MSSSTRLAAAKKRVRKRSSKTAPKKAGDTAMPFYPTRWVTVFAMDPSVMVHGKILRAQIEIPNEALDNGPRGYRAHIVDYDSTTDSFYRPLKIQRRWNREDEAPPDPFENLTDRHLLASPAFHSCMVYAIVMKTLSRFEYAMGRRVGWSFDGHQIQIAPHAFCDANAFYAKEAQGLFFGYFPALDGKKQIFTCLSHEVVAHETTHALLDGLREHYTDPSSPQQAGFHEGFADIVALLSTFSAQSLVARLIDLGLPAGDKLEIKRSRVTPEKLRNSALLGLADQMGAEISGIRGQALRRSVRLEPRRDYLSSPEYQEPHACGEVLVAAVINAHLDVWINRMEALGKTGLNRQRAAEEGAEIAARMLTVCIRAIDYCPPTDLQLSDFARALLTVDMELNPMDDKYSMRPKLFDWFVKFGILEDQKAQLGQEPGTWDPPESPELFLYDRTHFDSMKSDKDELFRFLWENRKLLKLNEDADTRVRSVRPCVRIGRDGFILRETVVEYVQQMTLFARELGRRGVQIPEDMPGNTEVTLYGGNALIFDEYGHVKYNIGNSILDPARESVQKKQSGRIGYLWRAGAFTESSSGMSPFRQIHLRGAMDWYRSVRVQEE
jgi:hypothetical protein